MEFVLKTRCQNALHFSVSLRSSPQAISTSWTHSFSGQSHWWKLSRKTRATSFAFLHRSPQAISTLHNIHNARTLVRRSRLAPSSSRRAISTLHSPSTLVRRFRLAPSSGDPPKLFPGFPLRPRSCLPSFLPPFLPAFLPSLLIRLFCLAPLAAKEAKREPKHRRCFWEKEYKSMTTYDNCLAHYWCHEALIASYCHFWWTSKEFQKHQKQLPEDPGKALGAMAS